MDLFYLWRGCGSDGDWCLEGGIGRFARLGGGAGGGGGGGGGEKDVS